MRNKEESLKKFGKHLQGLRLERRMSVQELAAAAGLQVSHLYKIEEGESNPLFSTLLALARALEVEPGELVRPL